MITIWFGTHGVRSDIEIIWEAHMEAKEQILRGCKQTDASHDKKWFRVRRWELDKFDHWADIVY